MDYISLKIHKGLRGRGREILSPEEFVFSFPFCVSVRIVIVAKIQACGKPFKMSEALVCGLEV